MNTLPRAITAHVFNNPNTYFSLRRHWSTLMQSDRRHELSAVHHLLYLALLGKDWRKGFTPATNPRKLANGAYEGWILFSALYRLKGDRYHDELLAPFDGLVTSEMLQSLRVFIPRVNPYHYDPTHFSNGQLPFDAYQVPERLIPKFQLEKEVDHA